MSQSRGYLFVTDFLKLFLIYWLGLVIFLISRIYFTLEYGNLQELQNNSRDVLLAYIIGFRTDTMSLCYGLLPAFLLTLGLYIAPLKKVNGYQEFLAKFLVIYSVTVLTIFLIILTADFFFYQFFNDHLNILVFALIDDDTAAVLTSMWTDYPALKIILLIFMSITGFIYLIKRIVRLKISPFQLNAFKSIAATLLSLVLVFTGLRNSWGTFPLRIQNTIVSESTFINKIGVSGVYSLQNAFKDKAAELINTDINATLKKYKFSSVGAAMDAYLDTTGIPSEQFPNYLKVRTPTQDFLEKSKPHVVVIQMEGMSNHLLDFHSPDFNLLGELEHQLPDAYIFRNFVSASWTTIHSLEALIIASPETPVSQSAYRDQQLSSSAALPYLKAGYNTCFLTGAELAWRNLEGYLPNVYFKDIEGNIALKKNNPLATENEWGTHDEFLFDRIYQKLEQANGTPQFIYAMTTTNHTPYELPKTYQPYPVKIPARVDTILNTDRSIAMKNFISYQYANDCLGKFIKRINESKLKANTIVVAVGDHSILHLFNTDDNLQLKKISVPFILFVPKVYRPEYDVDHTRFGSHKDVFPTVFNISLSNAQYVRSGNNLLAPPTDSTYFFGVYRYRAGFSKDGCVLVDDKLFFNWTDDQYTSLVEADKSERTEYLQLKTRAYSAAMSCFIKDEFLKNKEKN